MVSLGDAGADLVERFSVIGVQLGERLRQGVTGAERRLVADVLSRIRENLESLDASQPLEVDQ
jgi:hypothetical protein